MTLEQVQRGEPQIGTIKGLCKTVQRFLFGIVRRMACQSADVLYRENKESAITHMRQTRRLTLLVTGSPSST